MAKYETMLITSAALDEEASAALVGKFKSLIEANGVGQAPSGVSHQRRGGRRLHCDQLHQRAQLPR